MHKLDEVAARNKLPNGTNDITRSGPHAIEQKTGNRTARTARNSQDDQHTQKSQLTAFLLSLFLGWLGADWFYLARQDGSYIAIGIVKLLITLLGGSNCECLSGIFGCAALIWWIADWARILDNQFPDGNGHSLAPF